MRAYYRHAEIAESRALSTRALPPPDLDDGLDRMAQALESQGVMGALRYLNSRVAHRYTGIYKIQDGMVANVFLFDEQHQAMPLPTGLPLMDSFCRFITADEPLVIQDSNQEEILKDHKYRGVVLSYCGVGLSNVPGRIVGSLCHFDFRHQWIAPEEAAFLIHAREPILASLKGFDR
jgi:hypothetical protein